MNHDSQLPMLRPGPECASFAPLLPLLDASDPHTPNPLREHLDTCAYCQAQRATYDRLDAALRRHFGASATAAATTATPLFSPEAIMSLTTRDQRQEPLEYRPHTAAAPTPPHNRRPQPRAIQRIGSAVSCIAAVLVVGVLIAGLLASRGVLRLPKAGTSGSSGTPAARQTPTQQTPYTPGADDVLSGLQVLSPTQVWAVGGAYTVSANGKGTFSALALRYVDGQGWLRMATPADANLDAAEVQLQSIAMPSPDEGWAVGFATISGNTPPIGVILRYRAGHWSKWSEIPDAELWSVQMLSPTDGWIAGGGGWSTAHNNDEQGATTGILLHYHGGTWTSVQAPDAAGIHSLAMMSSTDGWATSQDAILHYDGSHWSVFQHLQGIAGVSMDSATDGWAFGGLVFPETPSSSYSEVWHFDGRQWTPGTLPSAVTYDSMFGALAMDSASDGWAVGQVGGLAKGTPSQTVYLHYTHGQWTQVEGPQIAPLGLNALSMPSAQEGWAVGVSGVLLHFHDGVWSKE